MTIPRILSQQYQKGFVLTDFIARDESHTYFVSVESAIGHIVLHVYKDHEEAERCFDSLVC